MGANDFVHQARRYVHAYYQRLYDEAPGRCRNPERYPEARNVKAWLRRPQTKWFGVSDVEMVLQHFGITGAVVWFPRGHFCAVVRASNAGVECYDTAIQRIVRLERRQLANMARVVSGESDLFALSPDLELAYAGSDATYREMHRSRGAYPMHQFLSGDVRYGFEDPPLVHQPNSCDCGPLSAFVLSCLNMQAGNMRRLTERIVQLISPRVQRGLT